MMTTDQLLTARLATIDQQIAKLDKERREIRALLNGKRLLTLTAEKVGQANTCRKDKK